MYPAAEGNASTVGVPCFDPDAAADDPLWKCTAAVAAGPDCDLVSSRKEVLRFVPPIFSDEEPPLRDARSGILLLLGSEAGLTVIGSMPAVILSFALALTSTAASLFADMRSTTASLPPAPRKYDRRWSEARQYFRRIRK